MATIYATRNDLILHGIPVEILNQTPSEIIDANLAYASSRIDDALDPGTELPLNPVPISIVRDCAVIAGYGILRVRGFNPDGSDKLIVDSYKETIERLEQVGKRQKAIVRDRDNPAQPLRTYANVRGNVYTGIADGTDTNGQSIKSGF